MHLLALTTSYPLRAGMAAGVFVRRLYEHLPTDWSVDVLCPDDDAEPGSDTTTLHAIPVRYAPRRWQRLGQRSGGILPALHANRWLLMLLPALLIAMAWMALRRARHADLIHANWSVSGVIGVVTGRLTGKGVVTTVRGEDAGGARRPTWARPLLSTCVHGSDAVVCVSRAMSEELTRLYPQHAGKIHVIHNGVDQELFDMVRPNPLPGCLRLLAIGSLVRRKGFDVLLEALAIMEASCRVELLVAGDGPERETLAEYAKRLPASRNVAWLGEVPPERVPALLAGVDVLVLSSRSEGRPNVVLEALAAGLPVISTRLPGVRDLVVDRVTGWLVDVDDTSGMAKALESACDTPTRLSLGESARRAARVRGESWESAAASYAELFRNVIARRGGCS